MCQTFALQLFVNQVRTKWTPVAGPMKHTPNVTVVLKRLGMRGVGPSAIQTDRSAHGR